MAYRHRRNRNQYVSYGRTAKSTSVVTMPPTVEDLNRFAICHVLSLSQFIEEDQDEELIKTLQAKRRVVYNMIDLDNEEKGVQLEKCHL